MLVAVIQTLKSGAPSLLESVNACRTRLYGDFRGPGRLENALKGLLEFMRLKSKVEVVVSVR